MNAILVTYIPYFFMGGFWAGSFCIFSEFSRIIKDRKHGALLHLRDSNNKKESIITNQIKKIRSRSLKNAYTAELSSVLAYIKNIAILGRAENISAQTLLEEISDISDRLKPVFLRMAHYLSVNDKTSASVCLGDAIGTSSAYDIGSFLSSWDDLPSSDMLSSIEMYRNSLREEKITAQKRRDETISDLVYFPVVINCMAVLLDFVYVAYFIEQKDLLSVLF